MKIYQIIIEDKRRNNREILKTFVNGEKAQLCYGDLEKERELRMKELEKRGIDWNHNRFAHFKYIVETFEVEE